jgi:hypothetical protein
MEPVVEREGFDVNELLALGNDCVMETTGLGVPMKSTGSLLTEVVGESEQGRERRVGEETER